jgi:hypothetical protein
MGGPPLTKTIKKNVRTQTSGCKNLTKIIANMLAKHI